MFYKFGLEAFNGSITTLAVDRFGKNTFKKQGMLQGFNQAFQCVGSILIAPLIKRFPTRSVLACAIMAFGLLTALLMIVDAGTGGIPKPKGAKSTHYGTWNPNILFPVYSAAGIAYGMVELIRRVIPRDIVGGDVNKLRRMDAIVHIFYEVSGTAGAFATTYLVLRFGNNYSFFITPIFFTCACIIWSFVSTLQFEREEDKRNYFFQLLEGIKYFGLSIWVGGRIVFSHRKFIWLPLGYSMALYAHRYLENGIAPIIAKKVFNVSAYSQILVGGSNFGELCGAFMVFVLNDFVPTPIPWLRADSLLLLIVWSFSFYYPPAGDVKYAWYLALVFLPISFGWAAGDVSLAAYIQACLARRESESGNVSALGAVMAFLYSTYIVTYAILQPLLGSYVDDYLAGGHTPQQTLKHIAGVQFTVVSAILLASTFIPQGALSINPRLLFDEDLSGEIDEQSGKDTDFEIVNPKIAEIDNGDGVHLASHIEKKHPRPSFDEKEDVPMGMMQAAHDTH